jgi:His-Xaa-Ser system protein HxsD
MQGTKKVCILEVDDRLFCPEAILKASYLFVDNYFISPSYRGEHTISICIESKGTTSVDQIDKLFCNELIAQMVRYNLSQSNKVMKELILGRALYSTCLDTAEPNTFADEPMSLDYSLDDIAVSWFDVHEEC